MKDKITKKKKKYDYYRFLLDKKLYGEFKHWLECHSFKSLYKAMHDFIVARGLWSDFKLNTRYRNDFVEIREFVHSPWLTV